MHRHRIALGVFASLGSLAGAQTFTLGDYEGQWSNTTFGSSGAASLSIGDTGGGMLSGMFDLDGQVFGQGDPGAVSFSATLLGDAVTIDPFSDTTFGDVSGGIDDLGNLSIDLVNAGNGAFALVTLRGVAVGDSIQFDYEIYTAVGTPAFAVGVVELNLVPAPGALALLGLGGLGGLAMGRRRR